MANGFEFNGKHSLSDFGIGVKNKKRPLLAGRRNVRQELPTRAGSLLFPGPAKDTELILECAFIDESVPALRTTGLELAEWLYTDEKAFILLDDMPGKAYRGIVEDELDLDSFGRLGIFTIPFVVDPFVYGAEEISQTITAGYLDIENPGKLEIPIKILATYIGSASNAVITNQATGKALTLTGTINAGSVFEIDTGYEAIKVAKLNGVQAIKQISGAWLTLTPGVNRISVSNSNVHVQIITRAMWR